MVLHNFPIEIYHILLNIKRQETKNLLIIVRIISFMERPTILDTFQISGRFKYPDDWTSEQKRPDNCGSIVFIR